MSIVNNWWRKSAGAGKIPADTAGQWVKLEQEFDCFESDNGAYSVVIFALGHKGEFSVADVSLVAVDALAREWLEEGNMTTNEAYDSIDAAGAVDKMLALQEAAYNELFPEGVQAAEGETETAE